MASKLKTDLETLVKKEVISQEIADKIKAYYNTSEVAKPNKLFMVFGVLGALLVGLGIILILAHNWDSFSKTNKLVIAFAPLVIGQILAGFSLFKKKSTTWIEGTGTFLFFGVGACIALISQVYNLPDNLDSYLLIWILLCIPLVYVLRSKAVFLLCLIFATYYGCHLGYGFLFKSLYPWWYLIMLAALLPYYLYWLRADKTSNALSVSHWLIALSLVLVLGAFIKGGDYYVVLYILLFGLLYNLGRLPYFLNQRLRRNGYLVIGSLGTIITLLITSFNEVWTDINSDIFSAFHQNYLIASVLLLGCLVLLYKTYRNKASKFSLFQIVFIVFIGLFMLSSKMPFVSLAGVNLLVLVLGLNAIQIGVRRQHLGVLNYGLFIVSILIVWRFFDTDISFIIKGLLFVGIGVGFFVANYVLLKRKQS